GKVTFEYKKSATDQKRITTVTAEEFIRRFLQHVLPERFIKVRYYGLLSPTNRHLLNRVREVLTAGVEQSKSIDKSRDAKQPSEAKVRCCPKCGSSLILVESLKPQGRSPYSRYSTTTVGKFDNYRHLAAGFFYLIASSYK